MRHGPHPGRRDRAEPLANPARTSEGDVMRTLRRSLAGMAILALLGGLGGAVLAQEQAEPIDPMGLFHRPTKSNYR